MKSAAQRLDRQESAINRCQTETNHWHAGVQHRGRGLHSSILLSGIHGTDASTHATRRTAGDSLPSAFFYSDLMGYRPDWRIIILFWFRPVTTHDCHPRSQAWTQSENRTPETNHTQTDHARAHKSHRDPSLLSPLAIAHARGLHATVSRGFPHEPTCGRQPQGQQPHVGVDKCMTRGLQAPNRRHPRRLNTGGYGSVSRVVVTGGRVGSPRGAEGQSSGRMSDAL